MEHVIIWEGTGWYADCGRWNSDGKSYVEGRRIATPDQFDQTGAMTKDFEDRYNEPLTDPNDDDWRSPYIWDWEKGRGTPYWLEEEPK